MTARQHTNGLLRGIPKDYRPVVRAALAAGWTFEQRAKGHPILTSPDGFRMPIPGTSTSVGLYRSIVKRLRDHGVKAA